MSGYGVLKTGDKELSNNNFPILLVLLSVFYLIPTVPGGNAYEVVFLHSHAGAWERGILVSVRSVISQ